MKAALNYKNLKEGSDEVKTSVVSGSTTPPGCGCRYLTAVLGKIASMVYDAPGCFNFKIGDSLPATIGALPLGSESKTLYDGLNKALNSLR